MLSYQTMHRNRYSPALGSRTGLRFPLGQATTPTTPEKVKAVTGIAGTAMFALAGLTTWVGINTGLRSRGLLSVVGWTVAGAAIVAGAIDLMATLGIVMMSKADIQRAIDEGRSRAGDPSVTSESAII